MLLTLRDALNRLASPETLQRDERGPRLFVGVAEGPCRDAVLSCSSATLGKLEERGLCVERALPTGMRRVSRRTGVMVPAKADHPLRTLAGPGFTFVAPDLDALSAVARWLASHWVHDLLIRGTPVGLDGTVEPARALRAPEIEAAETAEAYWERVATICTVKWRFTCVRIAEAEFTFGPEHLPLRKDLLLSRSPAMTNRYALAEW